MADYVGDELLGLQIGSSVAQDALALSNQITALGLSLQDMPNDRGYVREYTTDHAEEILEWTEKAARQLADSLHRLQEYTRTAAIRNR